METTHYVYILRCCDGTYYHGYTKDLNKRLLQHRSSESPPTRRKLPVELVYFETFPSKTEAMKRERQLKNGRTCAGATVLRRQSSGRRLARSS
jgi:putative endonuclease